MSGETRQAVSGWTVDTVKEYLDGRITDLDRQVSSDIVHVRETAVAAQRNSQTAIDKVEATTKDKFESVNEFRKTLADQSDRMMPRVECDARLSALSEKMDIASSKSVERLELVIGRLDKLETRLNIREGAEAGSKDSKIERREDTKITISMVVMIVAVVGVVAGVLGSLLVNMLRATGAH